MKYIIYLFILFPPKDLEKYSFCISDKKLINMITNDEEDEAVLHRRSDLPHQLTEEDFLLFIQYIHYDTLFYVRPHDADMKTHFFFCGISDAPAGPSADPLWLRH